MSEPNESTLDMLRRRTRGMMRGTPTYQRVQETGRRIAEQYGLSSRLDDAREAAQGLPEDQRTRVEADLEAIREGIGEITGKLDDANAQAKLYFGIGLGGAAVGVIVGLAGIVVSVLLALWL